MVRACSVKHASYFFITRAKIYPTITLLKFIPLTPFVNWICSDCISIAIEKRADLQKLQSSKDKHEAQIMAFTAKLANLKKRMTPIVNAAPNQKAAAQPYWLTTPLSCLLAASTKCTSSMLWLWVWQNTTRKTTPIRYKTCCEIT